VCQSKGNKNIEILKILLAEAIAQKNTKVSFAIPQNRQN